MIGSAMGNRRGLGRAARRLAGAALVALIASTSTSVAYAAFVAVVGSSGNELAAGSVALSDNGTSAMFSMPSVTPGATGTSCIRVTYAGSLPATARLYGTASGALSAYVAVKVTRGGGSAGFGDCSGFTPDVVDYVGAGSGVVFDGTLGDYPTSWTAGLIDPASSGGSETWTTGEAHDYRFEVMIRDGAAVWGQSASATFHWEARNT